MKDFTLRKRFLDCKSGTSSSFKGFIMLVVLMLMTTSSAMAEVIDGIRYVLDPVKKLLRFFLKLMDIILVILLFQRRLRVMMG